MLTVPTAAVPSQNFNATLDGQNVQVNVYQLGTGEAAALYMDLVSDGVSIFSARICRGFGGQAGTAAPFMCAAARYLGFKGDFVWLDTQATDLNPALDPEFAGLGTRWVLMYFSEADLQAAGLIE